MAAVAIAIGGAGAAGCAPEDIAGPPYPGSDGAFGSGDLDSEEGCVVRAPNAGAAAVDLAFRTGNADFIGTRDLGAAGGPAGASLALTSVGWRAAAATRRLAMPLRVDRAGSLSLSAAKKARCREL